MILTNETETRLKDYFLYLTEAERTSNDIRQMLDADVDFDALLFSKLGKGYKVNLDEFDIVDSLKTHGLFCATVEARRIISLHDINMIGS
jgi:hypothetical protein